MSSPDARGRTKKSLSTRGVTNCLARFLQNYEIFRDFVWQFIYRLYTDPNPGGSPRQQTI